MHVLLHARLSCMVTAEPTLSILGDRSRVSCQGPREPVEGCQTPLLGLKCEQSSRNKHLWTALPLSMRCVWGDGGGGLVEEGVGFFGGNDSDRSYVKSSGCFLELILFTSFALVIPFPWGVRPILPCRDEGSAPPEKSLSRGGVLHVNMLHF